MRLSGTFETLPLLIKAKKKKKNLCLCLIIYIDHLDMMPLLSVNLLNWCLRLKLDLKRLLIIGDFIALQNP